MCEWDSDNRVGVSYATRRVMPAIIVMQPVFKTNLDPAIIGATLNITNPSAWYRLCGWWLAWVPIVYEHPSRFQEGVEQHISHEILQTGRVKPFNSLYVVLLRGFQLWNNNLVFFFKKSREPTSIDLFLKHLTFLSYCFKGGTPFFAKFKYLFCFPKYILKKLNKFSLRKVLSYSIETLMGISLSSFSFSLCCFENVISWDGNIF